MEPKPSVHELIETPRNAWLFDIDGVITSPIEKAITEPNMVPEIIRRLNIGEPVSLVSGRALGWIRENVLAQINDQANDKSILERLFVSAEFGGVSLQYKDGEEIEEVDEIRLSPDIIEKASRIVLDDFSDIVFVDPIKITYFTAEMNNGASLDEFRKRQKELSVELNAIVVEADQSDEIEVHNDRIATNVKNKNLNKHLAVKKVLEWLDEKGIDPQTFRVFGDSTGDFEMGMELQNRNKKFEFIYVGETIPEGLPFRVTHQGGVDSGTVDYLKRH